MNSVSLRRYVTEEMKLPERTLLSMVIRSDWDSLPLAKDEELFASFSKFCRKYYGRSIVRIPYDCCKISALILSCQKYTANTSTISRLSSVQMNMCWNMACTALELSCSSVGIPRSQRESMLAGRSSADYSRLNISSSVVSRGSFSRHDIRDIQRRKALLDSNYCGTVSVLYPDHTHITVEPCMEIIS